MKYIIIKHLYDSLGEENRSNLRDIALKQLIYFESQILDRDNIELPDIMTELVRVSNFESARKHCQLTANHMDTMNMEIERNTFFMIEMILANWLETYDPKKTFIENYIEIWQSQEI